MKAPDQLNRIHALAGMLGNHPHSGARVGQLTLPELGALVVVAGRASGFWVGTETRCDLATQHMIDCVWFDDPSHNNPVVAWEFDARDVARSHLEGSGRRRGTFEKLRGFKNAIKVQALYSIRGKRMLSKQTYLDDAAFQKRVSGDPIKIYTDEELISGKLLEIVNEGWRMRGIAG